MKKSICLFGAILTIAIIITACKPKVDNTEQPKAVQRTELLENLMTKSVKPIERRIIFKLPLLQPMFHWRFNSRKDFLSGKLVLSITRNNKTEDITIFEEGKISDDWEPQGEQLLPGEIYFGFQSTKKYLTAPGDKLKIELKVLTDLDGIGSMETGILKSGTYLSAGKYSGLIDKYDTSSWENALSKEGGALPKEQIENLHKIYDYLAMMENWEEKWSLEITGNKGWLTEEQRKNFEKLKKQMDSKKKP
jgi:hypothetical protein